MTRPLIAPARQPRPVPRREAERVLAAEQLEELRALRQTMTEFAGRLGGQIVNNVLAVEALVFADSLGVERSWHAAAGAIRVVNLSAANIVTVVAGASTGYAPTSGRGVYFVRPSSSETISIASHVVTFYGTAADKMSYQAWTIGVRPSAGG